MFARHPILRGLAFTVLLAAAGCATTAGQPGEQARTRIVVVVRNDNVNRATVYTTPEFGGKRLGVVAGKSEATFRLDWDLPRIRFRAEFPDGEQVRWGNTHVIRPGETWTFRLLIWPDNAVSHTGPRAAFATSQSR